MAYEHGMLETALAAAVGNDAMLVLELRGAFLDSAERHYTQLDAASDVAGWTLGACRLVGLAASFGAADLIAAANALAVAPVGDRAALAVVRAEIDAIAG